MLKELADKIEKLVNEKVEPEIIGHEGVDYVKTSYDSSFTNGAKVVL